MKELRMNVPYFQVPNDIFDENVTNNELLVYIYLCRCGNHGGTAFPSYNTIAKKCKISKRTAITMVAGLVRKGYLQKTLREVSPGENGSNIYTVVIPKGGGGAMITPPSVATTPYKEPVDKEPNNENDNGLLAQPISLPFQYPKVTSCISYYLKRYREVFGEKHPELKTKQWERVAKEIHSAAEEFCLDSDDLENMVNAFLESPIDTDFNINHFATGGILTNRIYEVAY